MIFPPSNSEFLEEDNFKCVKCGQCCRPIVKLSPDDVVRIEKSGALREEFLAFDPQEEAPIHKDTIRRVNGVCMFLRRKGDEFICSIYDHRPGICRKYPFINREKIIDCRPENWKYWMPIEGVVRKNKEE